MALPLTPEQQILLKECVNGDRGLSNYGLHVLRETSKVNRLPNGDIQSYTWDEETKLWKARSDGAKLAFFNETAEILRPLLDSFLEMASDSKTTEVKLAREAYPDYEKQAGLLSKFMSKCNTTMSMNGVWGMICDSLTSSGSQVMNHYSDWLPLKGGLKISLRTGETVPRCKDDLWSYEIGATGTRCSPQAKADVKRYYSNICRNGDNEIDLEYMTYLQTLMGYWMTFDVSDKSIYFLLGRSDSGKSDIINQMVRVLTSNRVGAVQAEVFISTGSNSNHQTYLLALNGKSLAFIQELPAGKSLNADTVKRLSGGDEMNIRRCNGKTNETVITTAKTVVGTNGMTVVDGSDSGLQTRIKILPQNRDLVRIPTAEREENLKVLERLKTQDGTNALFSYWLDGSIRFYKGSSGNSLNLRIEPPLIVSERSASFLTDSDSFQTFIDECCDVWKEDLPVLKKTYQYPRSQLQKDYIAFCKKMMFAGKDQVASVSQVKERLCSLTNCSTSSRDAWKGIRPRVIELDVEQILME
jgi:phage/plasmid-associated DNA primase